MKRRLFTLLLMLMAVYAGAQVPYNANIEQAKKLIGEKKYSNAMTILDSEAKKLNGEAMYIMATLYQEGKGVEKNEKRARQLAVEAGKTGYTKAYKFMGQIDEAEGVWWSAQANYEEMVSKGDPEGWQLIGQLYYDGKGVEKDVKKAFGYFKTAADAGDSWGALMTSSMLLTGEGTGYDEAKAFEYAMKARWSNAPSLQAYLYVAHFCRCGIGHKADANEARTYYSTLTQSGYAEGYVGMGLIDLNRNTAQTDTAAFKAFLQGAQAKANGKHLGVWTDKVYRHKDDTLFYGLGYKGEIKGNTYNPDFYLGICYRDGRGAPRDLDKAKEYFLNCRGSASVYAFEIAMHPQVGGAVDYAEAKRIIDEMKRYEGEIDDNLPEHNTMLYNMALYNFSAPAELGASVGTGWVMMNNAAEKGSKDAQAFMTTHKKDYHSFLLKSAGFDSFVAWGDAIAARKWQGVTQTMTDQEVGKQALSCYSLGIDAGEPKAYTRSAQCYIKGQGTAKDSTMAMIFYDKGAALGDAEALGDLAEINRNAKRMVKAKEFARRAINADKTMEAKYGEYKDLFEVGEENMGGFVIYVDSTSKHGIVVSKDTVCMDYKDAMEWAAEYKGGDHTGWRLPNLEEYKAMKAFLDLKSVKMTSVYHWGPMVRICSATALDNTISDVSIDELKRKDRKMLYQTFAVCSF